MGNVKYVSPETWAAITRFYVEGENSVNECSRMFVLCHRRIKDHLIELGLFRGKEKVTTYIKKSIEKREKRPGKWSHLK